VSQRTSHSWQARPPRRITQRTIRKAKRKTKPQKQALCSLGRTTMAERMAERKKPSVSECGQMGHYASDCRESLPDKSGGSERKAAQFMMCQAVTLTGTNEQYAHLRNSVLLDSQSTAEIFSNLNYLQNIKEVLVTLTIHTNGGVLTCSSKGGLNEY
jgi:hypothetical protein